MRKESSSAWTSWAIALSMAVWPFPSLANFVQGASVILLLLQFVVTRRTGACQLLEKPAWLLSIVLFLGYWLPEVLSIQPPNVGQIAAKALLDLRYLPYIWVAALAVHHRHVRQTTLTLVGILVALWTIDGLLQWQDSMSPLFSILNRAVQSFSGHDLCPLDRVAQADRISGLWGPCHLKFGQVMASVSPFLLTMAANYRRWLGFTAAIALFVVILLAGSRAAWLSYAIVLSVFLWRKITPRQFLGLLVLACGFVVVVYLTSANVRERFARTSLLMSTEASNYDEALSGRLQIWKVSSCLIAAHPLHGVGIRQFRQVYDQCESTPHRPTVWGEGPAFHPHQIILEILTETGLIGLICWLAAIAMAWQAWRNASYSARQSARPALVALCASLFPINTHLAIYSSFWGGVILMLVGFYVGLLLEPHQDAGSDGRGSNHSHALDRE